MAVDESFPEHPKTLRFCGLMRSDLAWAYLVKLWRWAMKYAKDGDLSRFEPGELELAVGFYGEAGTCYAAMVHSGFIDPEPRRIHDWMEHNGKWVAKADRDKVRKSDLRAGKSWEVLRAEVLERDEWLCKECGSETGLDIHHKTPLRKFEDKVAGNNPRNLITLCRSCHADAETEYRRAEKKTARGRRADGAGTSPYPPLPLPSLPSQDPDVSSEPLPAASEPTASQVVLAFPIVGKPDDPVFRLTAEMLAKYEAAFPATGVIAEFRKAALWLDNNPAKRKTVRGMPTFLQRWLETSTNRPHGPPGVRVPPVRQPEPFRPPKGVRCNFHERFGSNGKRSPTAEETLYWCDECQHVDARNGTRTGEPETMSEIAERSGDVRP